MKKKIIKSLFLLAVLLGGVMGCSKNEQNTLSENDSQENSSNMSNPQDEDEITNVEINVNNTNFLVNMDNTPTGKALMARLPSTSMRLPTSYDQDGVLKYYDMPMNIVSNPEKITNVSTGDLLMDGNDRLILYYQDAEINGEYTKVGKIENSDGLAEALGDGEVTFILTKQSL